MTTFSLSEVSFVKQLKNSPVSCIFRTVWHGKDCILKVVGIMKQPTESLCDDH